MSKKKIRTCGNCKYSGDDSCTSNVDKCLEPDFVGWEPVKPKTPTEKKIECWAAVFTDRPIANFTVEDNLRVDSGLVVFSSKDTALHWIKERSTCPEGYEVVKIIIIITECKQATEGR